jgi:hypothetical protein
MAMKYLKLGTAALQIKNSWEEFDEILLLYSQLGGKVLDTAMNYPINGNPRAFRTTLDGLINRDLHGCQLQVNLGAAKNDNSSTSILTRSYLNFQRNWLIDRSGNSIKGFGIHWDNRDDVFKVEETILFILETLDLGYEVTLSGIKNLELYAKNLSKYKLNFQLKYEDFDSRVSNGRSILVRDLFPQAVIEYYGIFGGLAKNKLSYDVNTMIPNLKQDLGVKFNLLIGPRNCEQLIYYKNMLGM